MSPRFWYLVGFGEISKPDILEWEVGSRKVGKGPQTRILIFKSLPSALWSARNPIPSSQQTKLSPHWLFQVMPQIILLGKEEIRSRFETDLEVERKRELKVKSKQCSHMYVTESQIRKGILLLFHISSHREVFLSLCCALIYGDIHMRALPNIKLPVK